MAGFLYYYGSKSRLKTLIVEIASAKNYYSKYVSLIALKILQKFFVENTFLIFLKQAFFLRLFLLMSMFIFYFCFFFYLADGWSRAFPPQVRANNGHRHGNVIRRQLSAINGDLTLIWVLFINLTDFPSVELPAHSMCVSCLDSLNCLASDCYRISSRLSLVYCLLQFMNFLLTLPYNCGIIRLYSFLFTYFFFCRLAWTNDTTKLQRFLFC